MGPLKHSMAVRYYVHGAGNSGLVREKILEFLIYLSGMEKLAKTTRRIQSSKFSYSIPAGSIVIYDITNGAIARVTDKGVSNLWITSPKILKSVKVMEWVSVR
jgi:hypothetical protein